MPKDAEEPELHPLAVALDIPAEMGNPSGVFAKLSKARNDDLWQGSRRAI